MASTKVSAVLCIAYDTSINWFNNNPVLEKGQIACASDLNLYKVGDGKTKWADLSYNNAYTLNGLEATTTELNYVKGVTSSIQTQINNINTKVSGVSSKADSAYTHAVTNKGSAFKSGLYKITTNSEGHVTSATAVTKSDITGLGIPGSDTNTWTPMKGATSSANGTAGIVPAPSSDGYNTKYLRSDGTWVVPPDTKYSAATATTDGLMSASDKAKLNGIAAGATSTTYTLTQDSTDGHVLKFTPSTGTATTITIPDLGAQTVTTGTISASGWSNKKYSFESTYPNATYNIEIVPASTITAQQCEVWSNAMMVGASDSNTITALGTVPTVDLPITIIYTKKK